MYQLCTRFTYHGINSTPTRRTSSVFRKSVKLADWCIVKLGGYAFVYPIRTTIMWTETKQDTSHPNCCLDQQSAVKFAQVISFYNKCHARIWRKCSYIYVSQRWRILRVQMRVLNSASEGGGGVNPKSPQWEWGCRNAPELPLNIVLSIGASCMRKL